MISVCALVVSASCCPPVDSTSRYSALGKLIYDSPAPITPTLGFATIVSTVGTFTALFCG